MKKLYCVLVFLLSSPCNAVYFENLSIEDGLSQGTVFAIAQDHNGFIWIGTNDGLNRYDGVEFVHFKGKSSNPDLASVLTDNRADSMTTDKDGNLWISTKNGLTFFDTKNYKSKHYLHDPRNRYSLPDNIIDELMFDSQGMLWLATNNGLSRFNSKTQQFSTFRDRKTSATDYQCSSAIKSIAIDSNDHIWVGSRSSLCKFNPETEQFSLIDYRNNLKKSTSKDVRRLIYNHKGYLWVGSENGLYQYFPQTGKSIAYINNPADNKSLPNNFVSALVESGDNQLWVGTLNGLGQLDVINGTFTNYKSNASHKSSLSGNEIFSLYIDRSGLLLVGTNGTGLNIYNPRQQAFKHITKNSEIDYSLSDPSVWEITKAFGYLWIGTSNGLNRIDLTTGIIKYYMSNDGNNESFLHPNVIDINVGSHRDLWIVNWNGMSHFTVDDERFVNYRKQADVPETSPLQSIMASYYDKMRDLVWIGSAGQGVAIFDVKTRKFTLLKHEPDNSNSLRDDFVTYIFKSTDNSIWFGTRSGISRYYPETKTFRHINDSNVDIGLECYAIKELSDVKTIIASMNGLSIINPINNELLKHYTSKDGLENDFIYSAEIDTQGNIWVGTNLGLSRINPNTHEIVNFNLHDGLQGYEFNGDASFGDGEYLYFGGYNGLNYFRPEDINSNEFIPPVMITGFSIHNKPIITNLVTEPIQLTYKDDFFAIEFAALDFTHSKHNQYAYKLEGFDKDWIYSKNRNFASYTSLGGGEYNFRVKAANKYGIWNEEGTSLHITITPPFWKTLWFRFVVVLSIIVVIYIAYTLRVRNIKARNKMLKEQVKARTADLEETLSELVETKNAFEESSKNATGVLHNVGNLLNSVNISAGLLNGILHESATNKFIKANSVLRESIDDYISKSGDGLQLLNYYLGIEKHIVNEQRYFKDNTDRLIDKLSAIKEAITAQQRSLTGKGFIEILSLEALINQTIELESDVKAWKDVKFIRKYNPVPNIRVEKAKLMQVLVNLYKNAKESMDDANSKEKLITIELTQDESNAYIKVSDTGLGIAPDKIGEMFTFGMTTKTSGHGFGLHSCANYMVGMGGKMWAESDGLGKGATFILQLPLKDEKSAEVSSHMKILKIANGS